MIIPIQETTFSSELNPHIFKFNLRSIDDFIRGTLAKDMKKYSEKKKGRTPSKSKVDTDEDKTQTPDVQMQPMEESKIEPKKLDMNIAATDITPKKVEATPPPKPQV